MQGVKDSFQNLVGHIDYLEKLRHVDERAAAEHAKGVLVWFDDQYPTIKKMTDSYLDTILTSSFTKPSVITIPSGPSCDPSKVDVLGNVKEVTDDINAGVTPAKYTQVMSSSAILVIQDAVCKKYAMIKSESKKSDTNPLDNILSQALEKNSDKGLIDLLTKFFIEISIKQAHKNTKGSVDDTDVIQAIKGEPHIGLS